MYSLHSLLRCVLHACDVECQLLNERYSGYKFADLLGEQFGECANTTRSRQPIVD